MKTLRDKIVSEMLEINYRASENEVYDAADRILALITPYNRTQHESVSSQITNKLFDQMSQENGQATWEGDWGNLHYILANALEGFCFYPAPPEEVK